MQCHTSGHSFEFYIRGLLFHLWLYFRCLQEPSKTSHTILDTLEVSWMKWSICLWSVKVTAIVLFDTSTSSRGVLLAILVFLLYRLCRPGYVISSVYYYTADSINGTNVVDCKRTPKRHEALSLYVLVIGQALVVQLTKTSAKLVFHSTVRYANEACPVILLACTWSLLSICYLRHTGRTYATSSDGNHDWTKTTELSVWER